MRVNALTDYALRVIIELARESPRRVSARELSEGQELPEKFIQQALTALSVAEIVDCKRGIHGGTALARPPSEITIADVVLATDAPILLVAKERPDERIYPHSAAGLSLYWKQLDNDLEHLLGHTTIEDLLAD